MSPAPNAGASCCENCAGSASDLDGGWGIDGGVPAGGTAAKNSAIVGSLISAFSASGTFATGAGRESGTAATGELAEDAITGGTTGGATERGGFATAGAGGTTGWAAETDGALGAVAFGIAGAAGRAATGTFAVVLGMAGASVGMRTPQIRRQVP